MNDSLFTPKATVTNSDFEFLETVLAAPGLPVSVPRDSSGCLLPSSGRNNLVLVIDSMSSGKNLVGFLLRKLGYEVDLVDQAASAIAGLWKSTYSLILIDLNLPDVDPLKTAGVLKQIEQILGRETPIIGMSFGANGEERDKCLKAGMVDFIEKAMLGNNLVEVLSRWSLENTNAINIYPTEQDAFLFDLEEFQMLRGTSEINQQIPLFVAALKTISSCLNLALDDRDAEGIQLFAQSLQEQCASFKLKKISDTAARIAADSRVGDWLAVSASVKDIRFKCGQVIEYIETRLAEF